MQIQTAAELNRTWGNKPCEHLELEKEYDKGSATGDYVCKQCGQASWGNSWNQQKVSQTTPLVVP